MTDFQSARTAMVDCQVRPADVTSYPIIEAMLWAPRERFVPRPRREVAYAGEHVPLAPGRVLLDARTFAKMVEAARVGPDDLVLDLACGLGYSTAVLARLAATVIAVEPDEGMARQAIETLGELDVMNAVVETGDPAAGDEPHAPYDVIFINGGVERIPDALLGQLRDGGRLVALRMTGEFGRCEVVTRSGDAFATRRAFDAGAPVLPGFAAPEVFAF